MSDAFTEAYIECALWSSTDEHGEPLDCVEADPAPETLEMMERDCAAFQRDQASLLEEWYQLGEDETRAGHDFWLTRNGHGAGFWDRFYGDQAGTVLGKQLSAAAGANGSVDLYIGDDGLIYQS